MPCGGRGAVHLVLGVQREHDIQRARQPRVRPVAAHPHIQACPLLKFQHIQCRGVAAAVPVSLHHAFDTTDAQEVRKKPQIKNSMYLYRVACIVAESIKIHIHPHKLHRDIATLE